MKLQDKVEQSDSLNVMCDYILLKYFVSNFKIKNWSYYLEGTNAAAFCILPKIHSV